MSWIGQLKSSRSNYCALALLALSVFAPSTIAASLVAHWKLKAGDRTEMAMLTGRAAYLTLESGGDAALIAEVQSLLDAHDDPARSWIR